MSEVLICGCRRRLNNMTKAEALELENKCDESMSKAIGEECTVSMALTGRLKVNFSENYLSLNKELNDISYIKFHGDYSDLLNYRYKILVCIEFNKKLFDKLIWSYDHKSELE